MFSACSLLLWETQKTRCCYAEWLNYQIETEKFSYRSQNLENTSKFCTCSNSSNCKGRGKSRSLCYELGFRGCFYSENVYRNKKTDIKILNSKYWDRESNNIIPPSSDFVTVIGWQVTWFHVWNKQF